MNRRDILKAAIAIPALPAAIALVPETPKAMSVAETYLRSLAAQRKFMEHYAVFGFSPPCRVYTLENGDTAIELLESSDIYAT